jgi:hypothetical protein
MSSVATVHVSGLRAPATSVAANPVDTQILAQGTWGCRPAPEDVRALRRYNLLLRHLGQAGEWTVAVLFVAVLATYLGFLGTGDFTDVVFWDGTNHACVLIGNTGAIGSAR